MTTSKTSSNTQTQAQTAPWSPAQPALQSILSGIGGQIPNASPNGTETNALNTLTTNSQNAPNYGSQVQGLASGYMGGDPTGLLDPALSQYNKTMGQFTNPQNLNPLTAPGMSGVLSTIQNDVGNSVNQQFAGAGRDLSGDNTINLARGISQGESGALLGQYNQNTSNAMNAATGQLGAAQGTASAITGNQGQGVNYANMVPGSYNANAMNTLQAQAMARGLPLNNLGALENLTVPIAGLGSQSSGTSNTQGTSTPSPFSVAMQALSGGQYGPLAGAGTALNAGSGILSSLGGFFGI